MMVLIVECFLSSEERPLVQIHQEIVSFLKAALECSIYINPTDPGLRYEELVFAARSAEFLEGEIRDAIPQATTLYFGKDNDKILPNKDNLVVLTVFGISEEPDYRNPAAFHRVFEAMRRLVREMGIANAQIERSELVRRCVTAHTPEHDVQISISILLLNEILVAKDGVLRFGRGKESYGSPGDQANRQLNVVPVRREARARAYPIVKRIIEARDPDVTLSGGSNTDQLQAGQSVQLVNAEWISAREATALLGNPLRSAIAICKRAHVGLVKSRARLFIRGSQKFENIEIPADFWWAEGQAALRQNWTNGDFETWIDHRIRLQAFGVEFRRADIELMSSANEKENRMQTNKIFIGHGRSHLWMLLRDFLRDRLNLEVDEFNVEPTAGLTTKERLEEMLNEATFAFLVMTAEDEQPDGTKRARENVIHEAGLFQGKLGFRKAIVMLEDGCGEFSNITGLGQIRFNKGDIESRFEEVRRTLEREHILKK